MEGQKLKKNSGGLMGRGRYEALKTNMLPWQQTFFLKYLHNYLTFLQ